MPKPVPMSAAPYITTARNAWKGPGSLAKSRQHFVSPLIHPLASSRHGIPNEPWLGPLSPTLFSQTRFRPSVSDGLNGNSINDHKPPDERILKLGRSKLCAGDICPHLMILVLTMALPSGSASNPFSSPTHPPHQSAAS